MRTKKPYLIRAIFDWCIDLGFTPHLLATVTDKVLVPKTYQSGEEITLNISTQAASKLLLDDDAISFTSRFSGISEQIYIPIENVKGIYAKENGEGIFFDINEQLKLKTNSIKKVSQVSSKKPYLKLVK